MKFGGYFLSLLLHAAFIALLLVWPASPPIKLDQPMIQISLTMGAPGGDALPSPVLGHVAASAKKEKPEPAALPQSSQEAPEARTLPDTQNTPPPVQQIEKIPDIDRQKLKAENLPQPKAEPRDEAKPVPIAEKKAESVPKKEQRPEPTPAPKAKPKPDPKPEPKPQPEKKPAAKQQSEKKPAQKEPSSDDVLKAALAKARAKAKTDSISGALEAARRDAKKQAAAGGGGGEGDGPGGGGLYDVYAGQVIMAVRPNWSMPTYSREVLVAYVRVILDAQGNVLEAKLEKGSPRADFNASTVNAVLRTRKLPPPPTPEQRNIVIMFNSQEMMGR